MSALTQKSALEAIPPILALLFDGVGIDQIAKMLVEHFGKERADEVQYALTRELGINIAVSLTPDDVLAHLEEDYEPNAQRVYVGTPEQRVYVGTPEQLKHYVLAHRWSDGFGELWAYERDDLIERLTLEGLIQVTTREDET